MNTVFYILIGFAVSLVLALPFLFWSVGKGKLAYSNSRVRGMTKKLLKEYELKKITDPDILPRLQKTEYWNILQFSDKREDYERELENVLDKYHRKLLKLSSKKLRNFFLIYYRTYKELYDLKLILYCTEFKKDKNKLKQLLRTEKYIDLLKYHAVDDIINEISKKHGNILDFFTYKKYGVIGLEYVIDDYYYRGLYKNSEGILRKIYRNFRANYLLKNSIRLKKLGYKESAIIDMLKLKKPSEIALVKSDINLLLKDFSKKDDVVRTMVFSGEETHKIFDYYFQNSLLNIAIKENLKSPFSIISPFALFLKKSKEINYVKNIWVLR